MSRKKIIVLLLMIAPLVSLANQLPEDGNLREACRKRIAGIYLDQLDQVATAKNFIISSQKEIAKLTTRQTILTKALEEKEKSFRSSNYSVQIAAQIDDLKQEVAMIEVALEQHKASCGSQEKTIKSGEKKIQEMKPKIEKVFHFVPIVGAKGPYPFRIDYLRQCEKFRYSCPLTAREARDLTSIFAGESLPLSCERYVGYLRKLAP